MFFNICVVLQIVTAQSMTQKFKCAVIVKKLFPNHPKRSADGIYIRHFGIYLSTPTCSTMDSENKSVNIPMDRPILRRVAT